MTDERPLLIDCVVGYREWILLDWVLQPTAAQRWPWHPGVNQARCDRADSRHTAPHHDCGCGLYARHTITDVQYRPYGANWLYAQVPYALGAVAVWGDIEVHHHGLRGQYAQVLALAWHEDWPGEINELVRRAAGFYDVPVVHLDELETHAHRHGQPLPDSVIPEAPDAEGWGFPASATVLIFGTQVFGVWTDSVGAESDDAPWGCASPPRRPPASRTPRSWPIAGLGIANGMMAITVGSWLCSLAGGIGCVALAGARGLNNAWRRRRPT